MVLKSGKMESGLEKSIYWIIFLVCFPNFVIKRHVECVLEML